MSLGLQYLLANELVKKSGQRKAVTSGIIKRQKVTIVKTNCYDFQSYSSFYLDSRWTWGCSTVKKSLLVTFSSLLATLFYNILPRIFAKLHWFFTSPILWWPNYKLKSISFEKICSGSNKSWWPKGWTGDQKRLFYGTCWPMNRFKKVVGGWVLNPEKLKDGN